MASHQRCSVKKDAISNFANFIKKQSLAQAFSFGFCGISENTLFTEYPWATASTNSRTCFEYQKYKLLSKV